MPNYENRLTGSWSDLFTVKLLQFQGNLPESSPINRPIHRFQAPGQAIAVLFTPISQAIALPSKGETRLQAPGWTMVEMLPHMPIYGYPATGHD